MPFLDTLIAIVSILIIVSKFLDCQTTASRITNPMQEQNPITRKLMLRFGTMKVIWFIFIISILIVLLSLWLIFGFYTSNFHKLTYIIGGMFVSLVQFAVAHTNKTMELNLITKFLLRKS
jgi:amino acid transporter